MNLAVVPRSRTVFERLMENYPAVIVNGLADAVAALARTAAHDADHRGEAGGGGITLLSAPGAALYAGCGWWRALIEAARRHHPDVRCMDILDCADGTGQAMAALRIGVTRLVLWPDAPGRDAVVAIAESMGGFVLAAAPPANAAGRMHTATPAASIGSPRLTGSRTRGPTGSGDKRRAPG
jgi:hypothetical protein